MAASRVRSERQNGMAATALPQVCMDFPGRPVTPAMYPGIGPYGGTTGRLHVRSLDLSLDDLLCFVIKPLRVTLGGVIGCLRRFKGDSCARYLLFPTVKVGCLVFMLSCPQSFGGLTFLLPRALSFFHGSMHLRLRVAHTCRDENAG